MYGYLVLVRTGIVYIFVNVVVLLILLCGWTCKDEIEQPYYGATFVSATTYYDIMLL